LAAVKAEAHSTTNRAGKPQRIRVLRPGAGIEAACMVDLLRIGCTIVAGVTIWKFND